MYTIKCDGYPLLDMRDDNLIVDSPKLNLEVNTVGDGSFTIHQNHPYYDKLLKLKSVFEVSDDVGVIFRGRMTANSHDWNNSKFVDLEGALGYFNDSTVRPYAFPDDWVDDAGYQAAAQSGNVVKFYLGWLIDQHNAQVQSFQRFKLGRVTVSDKNNYLSRSDTTYPSTWEVLKSKLFNSALGGYLCVRYEPDGYNYIDYLSEFELTNTQEIVYGKNLLDLNTDFDAVTTYSAILPIGATSETPSTDADGEPVTTKNTVTLADLPDGDITDDVVKSGDVIYSKRAVADYGFILAPVKDTTWQDVTLASNLLSKSVEFLLSEGMMLAETIEVTAVDLHFSDADAQSFRIYRNVRVRSAPHGHSALYPLTKLQLDLLRPQNTKITVGATRRTLVDINADNKQNTENRYESVKNDLKEYVSSVEQGLTQKIEGIDGLYFYLKYSPFEDGHVMTDQPNADTIYMGNCSTNEPTAPTDYRRYTWCKVRGNDGTNGQPGVNGTSSFFHVKYSNDGGLTFTENGGEVLGKYMGTCVTQTQKDPTAPTEYKWTLVEATNGEDGKDGDSCYFFVKFSPNANGVPMSETPDASTKYMGVCSTSVNQAPTDASAYTWTQCRGEDGKQGIQGETGADGRTQYLHIKYSDDGGATFTANDGEDLGAWIGTLVDFEKIDSANPTDYTWKKFTEDVDDELADIRQTVTEQYTTLFNDCQSIILSAVESKMESSAFESFKETLQAELQILSDGISGSVSAVTETLNTVNNDLQSKITEITKYFTFDIDGLTIGQVDNPNKVVIDNDQISILVNNVPVVDFKADGTALIPSLKVTSMFNCLGLQITEDENTINCDYVGV